jgi:hypothetical protein
VLEWDLPPADSLFSDDDDLGQSHNSKEKKEPALAASSIAPGVEAEQQQAKALPEVRRRHYVTHSSATVAEAVALDNAVIPTRPASATVVLDLRSAQGDRGGLEEEVNNGSDDGCDGDAQASASGSGSSGSEEDLEEFYASRRRLGAPRKDQEGQQGTEKQPHATNKRRPEKHQQQQWGDFPWGRRGRGRSRGGGEGGGGRGKGIEVADRTNAEVAGEVAKEEKNERVPVEQQLVRRKALSS